MPKRAYEGHWFAGLRADLKDRVHGDYGRANARLGFLRPPAGTGRVLWIKTDGDRAHARLAVETARAVRERRQDVRLVVTFEDEYREGWAQLAKLMRTGYGFGPADRVAATERVLGRLAPAGVIAVGQALRPELASALTRKKLPCCLLHGQPPQGAIHCHGFPNTLSEQQAWKGRPQSDAAFFSLMAEAQVEPSFSGVAGAHARALWWLTDPDPGEVDARVRSWRRSKLAASDILFVGTRGPDAIALSAWDRERQPLPRGAVVWVDDERFWPALAASCHGLHLSRPPEPLLWAALAGGRVVTAERPGDLDLLRAAPIPELGERELWAYWQKLVAEPAVGRVAADALRRYFWEERRRAAAVTETLLQMVYDW